jgi:hypothetical protein
MYNFPIILLLLSNAFSQCDSRVLRLNQVSRPSSVKIVNKLARTVPPTSLAQPDRIIQNIRHGSEDALRRTRSKSKSKRTSAKSTKRSRRSSQKKSKNETQRIRKKREKEMDSKDESIKILDMQASIEFNVKGKDDNAENDSYIGKIDLRQFDMNLAFYELFQQQAVMSMDPETFVPSTAPTSNPKSAAPFSSPVSSETMSPTDFPFYVTKPTATSAPTILPSSTPTNNVAKSPSTPPSASPSIVPNVMETMSPSIPTTEIGISYSPSVSPTRPVQLTTPPVPLETLNPTLSPSVAPTLTPTTLPTEVKVCNPPITASERQKRILDQLVSVSNQTSLLTPGTNQNDAYNWLLNTDPAQVCPENGVDVIQRYVMAVTYFSLGGENWEKCSASTNSLCEGSVRYLSGNGVCEWYNVTCLEERITGIVLGMCLTKTSFM